MSRWKINILGLLLLSGLLGCRGGEPSPEDIPTVVAEFVNAPRGLSVGTPLSVTARGSGVEHSLLTWTNVFGIRVIPGGSLKAEGEIYAWPIPEDLLRVAGKVDLVLAHNGSVLATHNLLIRPGPPTGIMETYVGPKTLVVNSEQPAMMITVPLDTFGNPVDNQRSVTQQVKYPGRETISRELRTTNLVSSYELAAGPQTGKILLAASADASRTVEENIELTPAWPETTVIQLDQFYPFADSRQEYWVSTAPVMDVYGNPVADGTVVEFVLRNGDGSLYGKYRAFTTGGVAQAHLLNPVAPTNLRLSANVPGGATSNSLALEFAAYVTQMPFRVEPDARRVEVGPLGAVMGQVVGDDLPVSLQIAGGGQQYAAEKLTYEGQCTFELPANLPPGEYTGELRAGGLIKPLRITLTEIPRNGF
ncbi:hypothetical protein [Lewinella sp. W8]|uniref:hypothetical protein n=1 Tax=Lewinella sp. W8 TaxID=2528208 RepID=UPI0010686FAF|nr:hypothetical protein [Lewinella sp. W8]MTB52182.1 hypothetical protein [Lewinella sp. W8]